MEQVNQIMKKEMEKIKKQSEFKDLIKKNVRDVIAHQKANEDVGGVTTLDALNMINQQNTSSMMANFMTQSKQIERKSIESLSSSLDQNMLLDVAPFLRQFGPNVNMKEVLPYLIKKMPRKEDPAAIRLKLSSQLQSPFKSQVPFMIEQLKKEKSLFKKEIRAISIKCST